MRRASAAALFVAVAAALAVGAGCKGETVYKDKQDTLDQLTALKKQHDSDADTIKSLNDQVAACKLGQAQPGGGGDVVVTIEGDVAKIKPGHGQPQGASVDDATTAKQSQAFLDMVKNSRGAIQKCYEQALKKNQGLQARTISLKMSAKFGASGDYMSSDFNPSLGDVFDGCLRTVAGRWKMPSAPASMTFQASFSLTPS
jgi:hypothetical protein